MKRAGIIAAAMLILVSIGYSEPELTGNPDELSQYLSDVSRPVLLVGEGEVKVRADRIIFTFSIASENESLELAIKDNHKQKAKIVKGLTSKGIPAAKIQALKLAAIPLYRPPTGDDGQLYKTANYIKVSVDTEKEYLAAASFIDAKAEIEFEGIEYVIADKSIYKKKALEQALGEINLKKQTYVEKLGVGLKLKHINESITMGDGERIKIRGSVAGIKTNTSMGLFVFKAQVKAEYIIKNLGGI